MSRRRSLLYNARRARHERDPSQAMMKSADYWVIAIVLLSAIVGSCAAFCARSMAVITWLSGAVRGLAFSACSSRRTWAGCSPTSRCAPGRRAPSSSCWCCIGSVIGLLLGHFVRLSIFNATDRFLGFVFGFSAALVVLGVMVIIGQLLHLDGERWWRNRCSCRTRSAWPMVCAALVGEDASSCHASLTRLGKAQLR